MGRRITLMLTALLAVAAVLFTVIYLGGLEPASEPEPAPDYTVMDKAELSALVLVNPNWHEPRARLAHLLLDERDAAAALQHILILAWAKWDTTALETELMAVIVDNPSQVDNCLSLLTSQRSDWLLPRELSVEIATLVDRGDVILENLPALVAKNPQHPLAEAALIKYLDSNPILAWDIAKLLGTNYLGQVVYNITNLPVEEQAKVVPVLAEKDPEHELTALLNACQTGGSSGLEALLTLEKDGFTPWDTVQYSEIKLNLLFQAIPDTIGPAHTGNLDFASVITRANPAGGLSQQEQSLMLDILLAMEGLGHEPSDLNEYSFAKYPLLQAVVPREAHERTVTEDYFRNLLSEHLFYIVEDWTEKLHWSGYDEHSLMQDIDCAAQVLAQDPEWSYIETILAPPGPPSPEVVLAAEARRDQGQINRVSLSPDGSQLIYFTANTIWWYDLEKEEYYLAQSSPQADEVNVFWTPNSRSFVLEIRSQEAGNIIQLYSVSRPELPVVAELKEAVVLGWQDNSTLLLSRKTAASYLISALEPATGMVKAIDTLPHPPILTPTGKTAWAEISGRTLSVSIQGSLSNYSLPQESLAISGWLPGDRGILLRSDDGEYFIVDFATAKITVLGLKSFTPNPLGWSPENKITGSFSLGLVNHIMVLDLEDMSMTHTGIVSYFGDFNDADRYWHIYSGSIYIYKIH